MGINIQKAKITTALAAVLVAGASVLTLAPAAQAAPLPVASVHTVHVVREVAKVAGKRYTVNFVVQRLGKSQYNFCKLVVLSPKSTTLYSRKLTSGQCWAVHTIWVERAEPLYFRSFSSQKQLLQAVRGEVREGIHFDYELNLD